MFRTGRELGGTSSDWGQRAQQICCHSELKPKRERSPRVRCLPERRGAAQGQKTARGLLTDVSPFAAVVSFAARGVLAAVVQGKTDSVLWWSNCRPYTHTSQKKKKKNSTRPPHVRPLSFGDVTRRSSSGGGVVQG
jgi:hypothetical protein